MKVSVVHRNYLLHCNVYNQLIIIKYYSIYWLQSTSRNHMITTVPSRYDGRNRRKSERIYICAHMHT